MELGVTGRFGTVKGHDDICVWSRHSSSSEENGLEEALPGARETRRGDGWLSRLETMRAGIRAVAAEGTGKKKEMCR